MFPDIEVIEKARNSDPEALDMLDSIGLFPVRDENTGAFAERVLRLRESYLSFEQTLDTGNNPASSEFPIENAERIPHEILDEAAEITQNLFRFSIDWVPAFFLSKGLGVLWGGCTFTDDSGVSVFTIRKNFTEKQKWFIYNRSELLAHEICHVARAPMHDGKFEEHFAYMTSSSSFRKYFGNCFQNDYDALLFIVPVFLLLIVEIIGFVFEINFPLFFFFILALLWPGYLLYRNAKSRKDFFRACDSLEEIGIQDVYPILFRSAASEIIEISRMKTQPEKLKEYIENKSSESLRWNIIKRKFIDRKEPENTGETEDGGTERDYNLS